jgi:probable F420-dependent oxidoreductase
MATLDFGVWLPVFGEAADPERFAGLARAAEDHGFDAVVGSDHVVFPRDVPPSYPGPGEGSPEVMRPESKVYEVFESLSYVAGITEDVRLVTSVCVAPMRHPVLLAKQALTLAALSKDRFEFGVAAGWLDTEFEILDVPFEERGGRLDEFVDIFDRACAEGAFAFDGPYHAFPETGFEPVPDERPKLWIGGHSSPAFRRLADVGDGWTVSRQTPADVRAARERIMNAWTDYDRDGEPEIAVREFLHVDADADAPDDRALVGSADEVVDRLEAYAAAGATRFDVTLLADDLDEQLAQLERIGEAIVPEF